MQFYSKIDKKVSPKVDLFSFVVQDSLNIKKLKSHLEKKGLHPRNKHQSHYDFTVLMKSLPALKSFVSINKYNNQSIDFANPEAVKTLNKALLKYFYNIENWNIPDSYLCPPIPGRAEYIHHVADVLSLSNTLLELIETTFIYAQLTLGTIFIFYVGINFWPLFKRSYEVHKVLFKPLKFSLWQTWIISLVGLICLFGYDGSKSYYKFEAGRYDLLGDLYTAKTEYKLAEEYYKVALSQDFMSHRTNYALASLALTQGDRQTAGAYFRQAIQGKGTPQAYIGLSNTLADEGLFFDAIFNLRNGNATFPKSGEIQNNLGYLYSKTNILDSTFYYYNLAQQNAKRSEIPEANLAAFFAKNPTVNPSALNQNSKYNSLIANQLILNKEKMKLSNIELVIPLDSGLSVNNFAYLYNRAVFVRDTNQLDLLRKLESKTTAFYEELQTARAFVEYYNGNKIDGLDLLASQVVSDTSSKTILARNTLTFWLNKEANSTLKTIPKTLSEFQIALQKQPLDLNLLAKATDFFNKNKQPNLAYQAILKTLRFRPNSPECQKIYILQCLNMGYSEFAKDGLNALFSITSPKDYDAFMKIYEAKKSEMESKLKQF